MGQEEMNEPGNFEPSLSGQSAGQFMQNNFNLHQQMGF